MSNTTVHESSELRKRTVRRSKQSNEELMENDPVSPPFQATSLSRRSSFDSNKILEGKTVFQSSLPPTVQPINWIFVVLLTIASYATRFYKISVGPFVLYYL